MEEAKLNAPNISQKCNNLDIAQWQWQSDPDPYKEKDSSKWTWQNYSYDENLIIEDAYFLKKKAANLKDYEIDFEKMVQVSTQDKNNVRRIKRQGPSRFLMKMPEANIIGKGQKTMNEAFGTVQHFLEYIMKRTPEAYTLHQRLKGFSLDCKRDEFEDIVRQVIACVEKGAEVRAKVIKARTGAQVRDFISEARNIIRTIENKSATFGDFLTAILKTYTLETFICYWLNELLRSEDWEEINVLTPYLVCLVYTFKLSDYVLKDQNSEKAMNDKLGFVVKHRLYLYRGAVLTEEQFLRYNPKKTTYFSWNGVTSTSRDRNEAKRFLPSPSQKISNIGVLFFIEADFDSLEDYHGMIDLSKYSHFPKEQEVILAPGTVFKLLEVSLVENNIYEIHLKVTKNMKDTHEEVALLGVLQNQAILKDKAIIDGLPSQEGFRMLELIRGNKLIRKLEIKNSGIEENILEDLENFRVTTNVKKENIKLVGNTIVVSSLNVLAHYFSPKNMNDIIASNKIRFRSELVQENEIIPDLRIKDLTIKDETIEMLRSNNQFEGLWKELEKENRIVKINFSLQKLKIKEDELRGFFEYISGLKYLKDLTLALNETQKGSSKNLDHSCQVISSLRTLKKLSLDFPFSDKGLSLLSNTFRPLESLQSLSIHCHRESRISNDGLNHIKDVLTSQRSLRHLSLKFEGCSFSDKEFDNLTSGIASLECLQRLDLNLKSCSHLSDTGIKSLTSVVAPMTTLKQLFCEFFACSQISSEGLNYLTDLLALKKFESRILISDKSSNNLQHALVTVTPLQKRSLDVKFSEKTTDQNIHNFKKILASISFGHLSLDFEGCEDISDEGIHHLSSALVSLPYLQYLSLNLKRWYGVSEKGLHHFMAALTVLTSLQYLSLNFCDGFEISDEALDHLKTALTLLTSLQNLSIDFSQCGQISDKGIDHLKNTLLSLTSLQHLDLCFRSCSEITDEGVNHLKDGLISLISLQYLSLNFHLCRKVSNKSLDHLRNALISLRSLQYLALNFGSCQISDEGIDHLKGALFSLTSLQRLSLHISYAEISDKGLHLLERLLISLTSLQFLSLDLGFCNKFSDEGLNHLKGALMPLASLQHLYLDFDHCAKISDDGLNHLKSALLSFNSLQDLSLHFRCCSGISDKGLDISRVHLFLSHLSNVYLLISWAATRFQIKK